MKHFIHIICLLIFNCLLIKQARCQLTADTVPSNYLSFKTRLADNIPAEIFFHHLAPHKFSYNITAGYVYYSGEKYIYVLSVAGSISPNNYWAEEAKYYAKSTYLNIGYVFEKKQ